MPDPTDPAELTDLGDWPNNVSVGSPPPEWPHDATNGSPWPTSPDAHVATFLDDNRTADDIRIDRLLDSDPRNNPALEQTSTPRFSVDVTVTLDHHRIGARAIGRIGGRDLDVIRAVVEAARSLREPGHRSPFVRRDLTAVGGLIDEWRLTADELRKVNDTPAADALALAADELEAATGAGRTDNPVTAIQRVAHEIGWGNGVNYGAVNYGGSTWIGGLPFRATPNPATEVSE